MIDHWSIHTEEEKNNYKKKTKKSSVIKIRCWLSIQILLILKFIVTTCWFRFNTTKLTFELLILSWDIFFFNSLLLSFCYSFLLFFYLLLASLEYGLLAMENFLVCEKKSIFSWTFYSKKIINNSKVFKKSGGVLFFAIYQIYNGSFY